MRQQIMSAICPECLGKMEHLWGDTALVSLGLYKCKACKYTCISDFVSGFWSGVRWGREHTNTDVDIILSKHDKIK